MHTILAVDDSPSMRQMVAFTLKNAGFNVVEAGVFEGERHHLAHRGGIVHGKNRVHCSSPEGS